MSTTVGEVILVGANEINLNPTCREKLARELARYADKLALAARLPVKHHADALELILEWRIYVFERSILRWSDGRFYMLGRDYKPWRKHVFSCTREELHALGLDEWDRRAIRIAHDGAMVPMAADCFTYRPRRQLARYGKLVSDLRDFVEGGGGAVGGAAA